MSSPAAAQLVDASGGLQEWCAPLVDTYRQTDIFRDKVVITNTLHTTEEVSAWLTRRVMASTSGVTSLAGEAAPVIPCVAMVQLATKDSRICNKKLTHSSYFLYHSGMAAASSRLALLLRAGSTAQGWLYCSGLFAAVLLYPTMNSGSESITWLTWVQRWRLVL